MISFFFKVKHRWRVALRTGYLLQDVKIMLLVADRFHYAEINYYVRDKIICKKFMDRSIHEVCLYTSINRSLSSLISSLPLRCMHLDIHIRVHLSTSDFSVMTYLFYTVLQQMQDPRASQKRVWIKDVVVRTEMEQLKVYIMKR